MPTECTCPVDKMPFGRCCKAPTSSDVIAGLEMALAQAAAMIERQQHVMQRAMDAWDTTTHQKNGDGRLWQCMEELRGECGKQPNDKFNGIQTPRQIWTRTISAQWQAMQTLPQELSGEQNPIKDVTIKIEHGPEFSAVPAAEWAHVDGKLKCQI